MSEITEGKNKKTVSFSQYSGWFKCPHSWYLNYLKGLRKYEAALNMATDLIYDRQGDKSLNWNDVWTIGRTHNIQVNGSQRECLFQMLVVCPAKR